MKNVRVLAVAFVIALSGIATVQATRTPSKPEAGAIYGYFHGGTLQSTAEGAVLGGVAGGVVGALIGGIATLPAGGVGAIPGAEIGIAVGAF